MIDLHLHLDGSLSVQTLIKLAEENNISLPGDSVKTLKPYICAPKKCNDLNEYLKYFEIPLSVLQTSSALEYAAYDLVKRLDDMKMNYAEIRFAPQLHTMGSLSQADAVEAVSKGIGKALDSCKRMKARVILCCMRADGNEKENIETINCAKSFLNDPVVAVDLAGAEGIYQTRSFKKVFDLAQKYDIPFTIHAGESGGPESVRAAIEMGAQRIGHGIRACEDEKVLEMLIERNIAFEMCPTSNLQTGGVGKIKEYPIRRLLKMGAIVTVNTDNMTVSDTDIKKEYALLKKSLSLTAEEEKMLLLNSVYASFLPEEDKHTLSEEIYKYGLYI